MGNEIQLFEDSRIRTAWDEEREEWLFSVVDIMAILTENDYQAARNYWKVLKSRLIDEGSEPVTICNQLKMKAHDGKMRLTDVANTEQLLRIIQSVPSPKAEPFKMWLARVGKERIDETIDPELAIDRALETYLKKGYSREWWRSCWHCAARGRKAHWQTSHHFEKRRRFWQAYFKRGSTNTRISRSITMSKIP